MQLKFCGAARQVTGSCFLFETAGRTFLVDCGLFQGNRQTRSLNEQAFPFDPAKLSCVVLTHAHLDHSGLLPRLVAKGFNGPIYTTPATRDLLGVLLPDAAWLQKAEAERAARHGRSYTPLYDMDEAREAVARVSPVPYDHTFDALPGVRARLRDAGHILGSAIVELWISEKGRTRHVVVSGDLGQPGRAIVRDPTYLTDADVVLIESTYGNRNHRPLAATLDELVQSLEHALENRGGVVLVPAFAVGRTQEFLYYLNQLSREGRLKGLNVFVDSPMAAEVTAITARHFELFDAEARRLARTPAPDGVLPRLRFVGSVQESMALNRLQGGAIIVAASGMCDGGRIRHHLKHHLPNPRTTVLIIGFQAAGTLGRELVDGARTVRILGEEVQVRAQIVTLGGFSAHADQSALIDWLRHFKRPPDRLYLVHGEEAITTAFAERIAEVLGWRAHVPEHGETVQL